MSNRWQHARKRQRNVCSALAHREATASALPSDRAIVPRVQWPLERVLERHENLVLLGFSRDGYYLLFYARHEARFELQWKRVRFGARTGKCVDDAPAFRLTVGNDSSHGNSDSADFSLAYDVEAPLSVWQSSDDALVVAIARVQHTALHDLDGSTTYHVSIAPSPVCSARRATRCVTSLRCALPMSHRAQPPAAWQLLRCRSQSDGRYHLVLHRGASVAVLTIAIVTTDDDAQMRLSPVAASDDDASAATASAAAPAWFTPPTFPIAFECETRERSHQEEQHDATVCIAVDCVQQRSFDVDAFIQLFLRKYAKMRGLDVVDYDLQLVSANEVDATLFMSVALELASSRLERATLAPLQPPRQLVLALFLALNVTTGACRVVRAMQQPQQRTPRLDRLSQSLATTFTSDLRRYVPPVDSNLQNATWTNRSVTTDASLLQIDNARFPVSIAWLH